VPASFELEASGPICYLYNVPVEKIAFALITRYFVAASRQFPGLPLVAIILEASTTALPLESDFISCTPMTPGFACSLKNRSPKIQVKFML